MGESEQNLTVLIKKDMKIETLSYRDTLRTTEVQGYMQSLHGIATAALVKKTFSHC